MRSVLLIALAILPMLLGLAAMIQLAFQPLAIEFREKDLWWCVIIGVVAPRLGFAARLLGWLNTKVTGEH